MNDLPKFWRTINVTVADIPDDTKEPPLAHTDNKELAEDPSLVRLNRPKFQRSIVWKEAKAREFRNSLSRGYPFGVVVLLDRGVDDYEGIPCRHYQILDGQQRLYWLRRMRDNFFRDSWFCASTELEGNLVEISRSVIDAAHASSGHDLSDTDVLNHVRRWAQDLAPDTSIRDFINTVVQELQAPSTLSPDDSGIREDKIYALLRHLQDRFKEFLGLTIPVLVVGRELTELSSDVFHQLNSGLRLSEFDILAADWSSISVNLRQVASATNSQASPKLTPNLADKLTQYANNRLSESVDSEDSEYEFEVDDSDFGDISLYEYLYGLSKHIASTYWKTLGAHDRASTLFFSTSSLLFAQNVSKHSDLRKKFPRGDHAYDVDVFLQAILDASAAIDDVLSPIIGWDYARALTNDDPTRTRSLPSGLGFTQAALYLATYIGLKYDVTTASSDGPATISLREGGGSLAREDAFKRNLPSWYLYDALHPFSGADAHSRLHSRLWVNESGRLAINEAMLQVPDFREIGISYWDRMKSELEVDKTPQRRRLRAVQDVGIMRLTYFKSEHSPQIDRDHVIPVRKCENLERVPINHIANFMPLRSTLNRKRQDRLWAYCIDSDEFSNVRNEITQNLLVPPDTVSDQVIQNLETVKDFLLMRSEAVASRLLQNLDLDDDDRLAAEEAFRRQDHSN